MTVSWTKHRSIRSVLMLLLYLAYFALLLETSDGNENPPASNRAPRKKKCDCLTKRCKVIENYTRELLRTPFFTYIPGKITDWDGGHSFLNHEGIFGINWIYYWSRLVRKEVCFLRSAGERIFRETFFPGFATQVKTLKVGMKLIFDCPQAHGGLYNKM